MVGGGAYEKAHSPGVGERDPDRSFPDHDNPLFKGSWKNRGLYTVRVGPLQADP